MDSAALARMLDHIRERGLPLHSLLIVRHSHLVLESYFYPYSGQTPHAWASVTKSIISALVGRAIEEGHIQCLSQPVVDFFPEYRETLSNEKKRITVEHLLKMASGFDCGYRPGELEVLDMERSADFVRSVLELPIVKEPGSEFAYCSGGMHLLSAIVARATGMSALEFAQRRLFGPLGIQDVPWPADPQGNNHGWSDLRMRPTDMARIGYLYLHGGRWCGEQIIPSDWVRRSTRQQIPTRRGDAAYGYGWWIPSGGFSGLYEAQGRGGQSVIVWPQKDVLVVINAAGYDGGELVPFFRSALRSERALPQDPQAFQDLRRSIAAAAQTPSPVPVPDLPPMARTVSGRVYQLEPNLLDLKTVSLRFTARTEIILEVLRREDAVSVLVGLDGVYRFSTAGPLQSTVAAKGEWQGDDAFLIDSTEADGINHFRLSLLFDEGKLTLDVEDLTRHFPAQRIQAAVLSK